MNGADILPTILGVALVAAAAVFALLPFARAAREEPAAALEAGTTDRFALYRQLLELEFDVQVGKLAAADYAQLSSDLLAEAGQALQEERGTLGQLDDEIEREIAAARAAFVAAGRSGRRRKPKPGASAKMVPAQVDDATEAARTPS